MSEKLPAVWARAGTAAASAPTAGGATALIDREEASGAPGEAWTAEAPSRDGQATEPSASDSGSRPQQLPAAGVGEEAGPEAAATAREAELEAALQQSRETIERLSDQVLRLQADFDNYRRRFRQELERAVDDTLASFARRLVEVADNLERALEALDGVPGDDPRWTSLASGVRLVHQQLLRAMADEGVARVRAVGEAFDPALHQVVEQVAVRDPASDMRVVGELQPGYLLKGRVLRPSLVRVGVFTARAPEGEEPKAGPVADDGSAPSAQTGTMA